MSFQILQIISVVGVAATVLLIMLVGWSKKATIENWQSAASRLSLDFPAVTASTGIVSSDQETALLELDEGGRKSLGLVTVFGDKLVTRKLSADAIQSMELNDQGLNLTLPDLTFPTLKIALPQTEATKWRDFYQAL